MTLNKNDKSRCKKYFLVGMMTISICVNRKLLRMKSTKKQENNRTLKRRVFFHLYVQTLVLGFATLSWIRTSHVFSYSVTKRVYCEVRNAQSSEF